MSVLRPAWIFELRIMRKTYKKTQKHWNYECLANSSAESQRRAIMCIQHPLYSDFETPKCVFNVLTSGPFIFMKAEDVSNLMCVCVLEAQTKIFVDLLCLIKPYSGQTGQRCISREHLTLRKEKQRNWIIEMRFFIYFFYSLKKVYVLYKKRFLSSPKRTRSLISCGHLFYSRGARTTETC